MHKVIVAVDESAQSLRGLGVGQALAEQLAAGLSLHSVVPDEISRSDRQYALEQGLARARIDDVRPRFEIVAAHSVVNHLVRLVRESSDVTLCMSTHARGALAETLLGSVASGVVKQAGQPVVLAGPNLGDDWRGPVRTLLVCLDGSSLSERILPHAARLAKRLSAEVRLLRATDPEDLTTYDQPTDVAEGAYLRELTERVQRDFGVATSWELPHGDQPAKALAEYARGLPNSLLMLTTHGRSGIRLPALGSVAHQLVRQAPCPVAVLRPEPD